jgi:hypothetical protein
MSVWATRELRSAQRPVYLSCLCSQSRFGAATAHREKSARPKFFEYFSC